MFAQLPLCLPLLCCVRCAPQEEGDSSTSLLTAGGCPMNGKLISRVSALPVSASKRSAFCFLLRAEGCRSRCTDAAVSLCPARRSIVPACPFSLLSLSLLPTIRLPPRHPVFPPLSATLGAARPFRQGAGGKGPLLAILSPPPPPPGAPTWACTDCRLTAGLPAVQRPDLCTQAKPPMTWCPGALAAPPPQPRIPPAAQSRAVRPPRGLNILSILPHNRGPFAHLLQRARIPISGRAAPHAVLGCSGRGATRPALLQHSPFRGLWGFVLNPRP